MKNKLIETGAMLGVCGYLISLILIYEVRKLQEEVIYLKSHSNSVGLDYADR